MDRPTTSSPSYAQRSDALLLKRRLVDYYELTKPRLSFMSVVTVIVGYLAADPVRDLGLFISLLIGTSMAAGGAAVLNQWMERDADARMARTQDRPIPAGRVLPLQALLYGLFLSLGGCLILQVWVNHLAAFLTSLTVVSYVLLYTPLKQLTTWNTIVGAIPGALPPLIGWAAAEGSISTLGWLLFAILFLWQLPHFYAIAWKHRKDYAEGGFVMLSNADSTGRRVAVHSFIFSVALLISTLLPSVLGYTSWAFAVFAVVMGAYLLRPAIEFLKSAERDQAARKLFIASVCYLPALLVPLVVDLWLF
ncbi:heme o synthase [Coraliomargarita akajimensis]|uniref:Protoheme IX farnesyltransferase n=1 Tax=Coraliomargarita akajimensis (strain DSM 45221 / IAM 15411 / JCM 23193 / KCTC 12865 / 04OKA010-24) TaxID=583355 RepID=D5EPE6_CORAD|nr:heme o synthase [Coraliomargarita akajimensis]ADE53683.1 protoheme IX farnesyltransferase [Coraliomargarita akajimensis DSM 45221]